MLASNSRIVLLQSWGFREGRGYLKQASVTSWLSAVHWELASLKSSNTLAHAATFFFSKMLKSTLAMLLCMAATFSSTSSIACILGTLRQACVNKATMSHRLQLLPEVVNTSVPHLQRAHQHHCSAVPYVYPLTRFLTAKIYCVVLGTMIP